MLISQLAPAIIISADSGAYITPILYDYPEPMTMDWLEHISVILPVSFFLVHSIPDFHSDHIQYALFHFLQAERR